MRVHSTISVDYNLWKEFKVKCDNNYEKYSNVIERLIHNYLKEG